MRATTSPSTVARTLLGIVISSPVLSASVLLAVTCALALQMFCSVEAPVAAFPGRYIPQPTPAALLCVWWKSRGYLLAIPFFSAAAMVWLLRLPQQDNAAPLHPLASLGVRVAEFLVILAALGFVTATLVAFAFYRQGDLSSI